ncbi:MAG: pyridoxal-phosphate dependent enzyme [Granulosicoccus sp.]
MILPPLITTARRLRNLPDTTPAVIRTEGDPVLTTTATAVGRIDDSIIDIIATLHATLANFRITSGFGRAIAAPQIGESHRIIALQLGGTPFTLINPEITKQSDSTFTLWDDCLSVPDRICQVSRNCHIDVRYTDESGHERHWLNLPEELSELVQHEIDHLNGVLMTSHTNDIHSERPIDERDQLIGERSSAEHRITLAGIRSAAQVVDKCFVNSPQYIDSALADALGCELLIKLETANPLRSFKGRGASYLVRSRLAQNTLGKRVVCASAGNWGQAVAYTCRSENIAVTVFAAINASKLKVQRMRDLGADVQLAGNDFDAAKDAGRHFAADNQLLFVEDGREAEVSEGHGTIAIELLAAGSAPDVILVPLGNGAMLTGIARWVKASTPTTEIIGVCASGADAMYRSWRAAKAISTENATTIADGIAVRIPVPEVVKDLDGLIDDVVLVEDSHIISAMQLAFSHAGLVLEPSGAAGIAAVLADNSRFADRRVAAILCGSNVSSDQLRKWQVI